MTPLAHLIAKQLTEPLSKRAPVIREHSSLMTRKMHDMHCFEATAVFPLLEDLNANFKRLSKSEIDTVSDDLVGRFAFLPAPKTWLEWRINGCSWRVAILLIERSCELIADATLVVGNYEEKDAVFIDIGYVSLDSADVYYNGAPFIVPPEWKHHPADKMALSFLSIAQMILVCINSPKIVGRRQHMPHRGLEKELTRSMGAGRFPLHGWTEILLDVTKPPEIDDGEPHEAHLTGRRALHFCRKHIRIRGGRLEYVRAHWRGDAALGMKQSRYKLAASGTRTNKAID